MGHHTRFDGATAVVTGAGSGIGAALARELARRGATVTVTDADGEAAAAVASEIGAEAARLDVTDAAAVEDLVARVAERGRLDLLFNNAGVSFGGRTEAMTLEHWRRMIEVDLMGVVHGVAAAWPRMVAQGAGHIVNTASAAGLVASPFVAAYAAAKHGVVGLSHSLRLEGAPAGVRVSVLCPGMVDTPILDGGAPADLPAMAGGSTMTGRRYLALAGMRPISAEVLASRALGGVERNRATIVVPSVARAGWVLARLSPGLFERFGAITTKRVLAALDDDRPTR